MIWVLEIEYSIESLKSFKLSFLRYLEVLHTSLETWVNLHLVQAILTDFFFPNFIDFMQLVVEMEVLVLSP